jgi:hypothetical protein
MPLGMRHIETSPTAERSAVIVTIKPKYGLAQATRLCPLLTVLDSE